MSPTVRLVASILALTALGGCSINLAGAPPASPEEQRLEDRQLAPAEGAAEVTPAPPSKGRPSWVPAHWEMQGRSKTWVDGHWG